MKVAHPWSPLLALSPRVKQNSESERRSPSSEDEREERESRAEIQNTEEYNEIFQPKNSISESPCPWLPQCPGSSGPCCFPPPLPQSKGKAPTVGEQALRCGARNRVSGLQLCFLLDPSDPFPSTGRTPPRRSEPFPAPPEDGE